MPRLFTAIEIPPRVRDQLDRLEMPLPGARWLDAADYHLTVRFFGDVENRVADELAAYLDSGGGHAFELRLAGVGQFGGHEPRSLWAGVEPSPALEALVRTHERAARQAGLGPERRVFRPHVTIARLQHGDVDRVARFLQRFAAFRSEPFTVRRFVLYSSRPQVGGGPYVIEHAYPLAGWGEDE
jgi:2'-5' RNA ligase